MTSPLNIDAIPSVSIFQALGFFGTSTIAPSIPKIAALTLTLKLLSLLQSLFSLMKEVIIMLVFKKNLLLPYQRVLWQLTIKPLWKHPI